MKADEELIEYLKKRYTIKKESEESNAPHGKDRFKHILAMGQAEAFREILMVLGVDEKEYMDRAKNK